MKCTATKSAKRQQTRTNSKLHKTVPETVHSDNHKQEQNRTVKPQSPKLQINGPSKTSAGALPLKYAVSRSSLDTGKTTT